MPFCNLLPNSSVVFQTSSAMTYLLTAPSTSFHGTQSFPCATNCQALRSATPTPSHTGYVCTHSRLPNKNLPSFTVLIFNPPSPSRSVNSSPLFCLFFFHHSSGILSECGSSNLSCSRQTSCANYYSIQLLRTSAIVVVGIVYL